ncbi:NADP oxidoreductase [Curtobacterium sp. MCPF17_011]|uniref:NADPH-dependent F420 reductase n=1 Tax=Curtobacterium sp. MCPF17_011 TaxID=2175652 RepID=UPI000DA872EF|nr:NAD(P)-binding domain-containing protein [Curtobacterium sp. MCPF17_011]PZF09986.1 NADP oxidoreductase [Curtobacterium sp. MCPF17_011]
MTTSAVPARGAVGIIGAGKSGTAIARLALSAGYRVQIASSGTVEDTELMMQFVAPGVVTTDVEHVADGTDFVVIAVPLRRFRDLDPERFASRTVVDVMNYWPPIDGVLAEFEDTDRPSSVIVQNALPTTTVVKTFNHLGYHQMEDLATPSGTAGRIALAVAGNDERAVATVMRFVDGVGFDPVDAGPLEDSALLQPETPVFGAALDRATLTALLASRTQAA